MADAVPNGFALRAVYLRQSTLSMSEEFDPLTPGQVLVGQHRTAQNFRVLGRETTEEGKERKSSAIFILGFEFRYKFPAKAEAGTPELDKIGDPDRDSIVRITAEIAIDYSVTGPVTPTHEVLQHWGNTSAMIHAWPYWREYCHSCMLRMNLPVTLIPMLDIDAVQRMHQAQSPAISQQSREKKTKHSKK